VKKNIAMNTIPWMKQSWIYIFIVVGFVVAAIYIILRLLRVFQNIIDTAKGKE
jgi:TRAP-type C4-dicarboxylate transport system permease small subunit